MSKIKCSSLEQFIQSCALLVQQGVIFNADADSLTIQLTGGF